MHPIQCGSPVYMAILVAFVVFGLIAKAVNKRSK